MEGADMSNGWLYVACACFRRGLVSPGPVALDRLDFDRFGNVKRMVERSPEESPWPLYEWRLDAACEHGDMRAVEEMYDGYREAWSHPAVEAMLEEPGLERVAELVRRRRPPAMAGVFVTAEEARMTLPQLSEFATRLSGLVSRVVVDSSGRTSGFIDRLGFGDHDEFVRLDSAKFPDQSIAGVGELGVVGFEFVVRDVAAVRDVCRSATLRIFQDPDGQIRLGDAGLARTLFIPGEGAASWCWAPRLDIFGRDDLVSNRFRPNGGELRIVTVEMAMADLYGDIPMLRTVLEASVQTGNPVVYYYDGCSLGYDIY
jgi:hypothetical protein